MSPRHPTRDNLDSVPRPHPPRRARNDLRQYDDLADQWWAPRGCFAMLHWIAAARAALMPRAGRVGSLLVDLGCGAGLLAPHVSHLGHRHLGVDRCASALAQAAEHGVQPVRADVTAVPLPDGCADVVSAGELLEHVADPAAVLAEACRLVRPGGVLVLDTIADTRRARFVAVTLAEGLRLAPRGIHDPRLFVDRTQLVRVARRHGVELTLRGLRPAPWPLVRHLAGAPVAVPMVATRSTALLFQAWGTKRAAR